MTYLKAITHARRHLITRRANHPMYIVVRPTSAIDPAPIYSAVPQCAIGHIRGTIVRRIDPI